MPGRVPHSVSSVKINPTWGSPVSGLPGCGRGGRGVQDPARQWCHQSSKSLLRAAGSGPPPGCSQHQPAWQPLSPDLQKVKSKQIGDPITNQNRHTAYIQGCVSHNSLHSAFARFMILCWGNVSNFAAESTQTISNLIKCVWKVNPVNHSQMLVVWIGTVTCPFSTFYLV